MLLELFGSGMAGFVDDQPEGFRLSSTHRADTAMVAKRWLPGHAKVDKTFFHL